MFKDILINQTIIVTIIGLAISIISSKTKPLKQKIRLYAFNATTIIIAISIIVLSQPENNYTIELLYQILAVGSLSMITTLYYYNLKKITQHETKTLHNIMWWGLPSVMFIILSKTWPKTIFSSIFIVLILAITAVIIIKIIQELHLINEKIKPITVIQILVAVAIPLTILICVILAHVNGNQNSLIGKIIAIACSLAVCVVAHNDLKHHLYDNKTKQNPKKRAPNYNTNTANYEITQRECGATDEHMIFLAERIVEIVETKKMYLKTDLRVTDIALKLTTNRTYISQAINQKLGYSFSDFINNYRIEFAQAMLTLPQNAKFTIEAIAEESGFSNVTSLNRAFKAKLNMTPHQYRQSVVYITEQHENNTETTV